MEWRGSATLFSFQASCFRRCIGINDLMINEEIRDREVRVVDQNGAQLGVMPVKQALDMAEEMQRMDEAHRELQDYVESIDDDLSDLTETLFSDEEEDDEDADDADECDCEDCADDTDDEDDAAEEENPDDDLIAYACPNCGAELTFHANDVDFDENTLCPNCHQPIFPEIDEDSEEETEE